MPAPRSNAAAGRRTRSPFNGKRLQQLYDERKEAKRPPFRDPDVAREIKRLTGLEVSTQYLHQLRRGRKNNPTSEVVDALAKVFGRNPGYFFDDDTAAARPVGEVNAAADSAQLSPEALQIGLRAANLSTLHQAAVLEFIEHISRVEERARRGRE